MKNIAESRTVRFLKNIFKVSQWMDWLRIRAFFYDLLRLAKHLFLVDKPSSGGKTFEDVIMEQQITEDDLTKKKRVFLRLAWSMLFVAMLLFFYVCYQLLYGSVRGVIVSCVVMGIASALSFRYHFWFFQITQRRLGCSWQQWFWTGLLGIKR